MSPLATTLSALLSLVFLCAGAPKMLRTTHYCGRIRHWRLPEGLLPVIGLVEVAGALLLLAGAATSDDRLAIAGATLLLATVVGATLTHVRISDPPAKAIPATALGVLATVDVALLTL